MKPFYLAGLLLLFLACPLQATTHTVSASGFTFSPATLTINEGDTVLFSIDGSHNAVEVSQTTWNSNGSTPLLGGFSVGFGGGTVVGLPTGTHFYVCQPHAGLGMKGRIIVNAVTGVDDGPSTAPEAFSLRQNYPNPFNPSTTISFAVGRMAYTEVSVYDAAGRLVKTLVSHELPRGEYTIEWDGRDAAGQAAGSGAYFVRMLAGAGGSEYGRTMKILLVR